MVSQQFNVLVMEKDQSRLTATTEALCSLGFYAKGFSNPAEAGNALQSGPFDCVFLEASAIETIGRELVRHTRASMMNQATPIVFLADADDEHIMREAFAAGGNFFIVKPADRAHLRQALEIARLAMLDRKKRNAIVPLALGVACAVADDCFVTQAAMISEAAIRVKRHPRLTLGTTVRISFRVPTGFCFHTVATVSMHDGPLSVLQLDGMTKADRLRLRDYISLRTDEVTPEKVRVPAASPSRRSYSFQAVQA